MQVNAIYSLFRAKLLADKPIKSKMKRNGKMVSCFRNLISLFFKKIEVPKSRVKPSPIRLVIQPLSELKSFISCGNHTIIPTTMLKTSTVGNDNIV